MNIKIIAVGKIREKFIKLGVEEFTKRMTPYASLKVVEVSPETLYATSNVPKVLDIEAEKILKNINEHSYVFALDIEGKELTSEKFAHTIKALTITGKNQLIFVIGGAEGLSPKIKKRADFCLSLSQMTFPHQLARQLLLEQLYRAFKIINNEPYHK